MKYDAWKQKIWEHLGDYKKNVLKISKNGIYSKNKKEYAHILPMSDGNKNYFCASFEKLGFKKHQDWYHLNSSQTLCVNFFAKLKNDDLSRLLSEWLNKEVSVKRSVFEHVPQKNSTNFDFLVEDTQNNNYFFEIKYTENGITKKCAASNPDEAYKEYYKEDCESNPMFKKVTKDTFLYNHYQAYRNMVKGKGEDYSIFITMESNERTYNELQSAIKDLQTSDTRNIIVLYWEKLVDEVIDLFKDNEELVSYYKEFKKKYIPKFTEIK